jgi:hypothetical protein
MAPTDAFSNYFSVRPFGSPRLNPEIKILNPSYAQIGLPDEKLPGPWYVLIEALLITASRKFLRETRASSNVLKGCA